MNTLKAVLLIILGSFFIATGFAFAGNTAYNQLQKGPSFDGPSNNSGSVTTRKLPSYEDLYPPPASTITPTPPKPTFGEQVKTAIAKAKTPIVVGAIGAYVGFALAGTLFGALTGGLGLILLISLAAL